MKRRVLIIGGGFTGLTAAWRLSESPGHEVHLWEKGADFGGLAGGFQLAGAPLEKAYHYLFLSDQNVVRVAGELGLADRLLWSPGSSGIYLDGRIHPFNSPLDLLRFSPCPLLDRLRTGLVALRLKRDTDPAPYARHRAAEWMERHCGAGAARTIWHPLLRGKFAGYAREVSMDWLWARLHIRARSRAGGGEKFGYIRGGFGTLADALVARSRQQGARLETGCAIAGFRRDEAGVTVTDDRGATSRWDDVLLTVSSRLAAPWLRAADPATTDYVARLSAVPYLHAVCLVFASRQELPAPFWLNVNEAGAPFLVVVHHTRMIPRADYGGLNVYYLGAYLEPSARLLGLTDEALRREWYEYLGRIFPMFDRGAIVDDALFRLTDAQHVVLPGHAERIPDHRTPVRGVYLANFAQIYPEDRGTNYAIRDGEQVARLMMDDAAGPSSGPAQRAEPSG